MADGYDYSEVLDFQARVERAKSIVDEAFMQAANRLALDFLREVKARTPQRTGVLRDTWKTDVRREGNAYVIEVSNQKDYAGYVESGHRQKVGQYVKAIGKRLVKPWVEGRFMMKLTEDEILQQLPEVMQQIEERLAKELLDNLG